MRPLLTQSADAQGHCSLGCLSGGCCSPGGRGHLTQLVVSEHVAVALTQSADAHSQHCSPGRSLARSDALVADAVAVVADAVVADAVVAVTVAGQVLIIFICHNAAAANGISKILIRGSTVSASVTGCAVSTYLTQLYVVRLRKIEPPPKIKPLS